MFTIQQPSAGSRQATARPSANSAPPELKEREPHFGEPVDLVASESAEAPEASPGWLGKGLMALGGLASIMATAQPAAAQTATTVVSAEAEQPAETATEEATETKSVVDRLRRLDVDYEGSLGFQRQGELGDYGWRVSTLDYEFEIEPHKLGADFEFDVLNFELANTETHGNWETRQGVRAGIRADAKGRVIGDSRVRAHARTELFKEWDGTLWGRYPAEFEIAGGVGYDLMTGEPQALFRAEQEVEGAQFTFRDHDYQFVTRGRQRVYQNLDGGDTDWSAEIFTGVRRNFNVSAFGKKGLLTVDFGPEFKTSNRDSFEVGPELRVRLRSRD